VVTGFTVQDTLNVTMHKVRRAGAAIDAAAKAVGNGVQLNGVSFTRFHPEDSFLDYVRSGKALAKVMEYAGEAVEALSVDERATMTNMAAEIGGFTGIVAPDEKVIEFLMERRGMKRAEIEKMIEA